jgi:hypothetical protein
VVAVVVKESFDQAGLVESERGGIRESGDGFDREAEGGSRGRRELELELNRGNLTTGIKHGHRLPAGSGREECVHESRKALGTDEVWCG